MKYDYENLEKILGQTATRWMIIKDAKEWLEGSKKEVSILKDVADIRGDKQCLKVIREILGQ